MCLTPIVTVRSRKGVASLVIKNQTGRQRMTLLAMRKAVQKCSRMSRGVLKPTIAPQNSNSSCSVLTACQNSDHFFHKLSCGLQLTSCLSLQPGSPRRSGEDENSPKYLHLYMFYYIVLVRCTVLGSLSCCGLGLLFSLMHYHLVYNFSFQKTMFQFKLNVN